MDLAAEIPSAEWLLKSQEPDDDVQRRFLPRVTLHLWGVESSTVATTPQKCRVGKKGTHIVRPLHPSTVGKGGGSNPIPLLHAP